MATNPCNFTLERSILLERLDQAKRHVVEGERLLAEQRARIAQMRLNGLDPKAAIALLENLEQTQALHIADEARVRAELEKMKS